MADRCGGPVDRALSLAVAAAERVDLDAAGARLLRIRTSGHVELPAAGAIARVEMTDAVAAAERQVRVARFLGDRGAPVPRLIRPETQPFLFEDGAVTLWHRIEPVGRPAMGELGGALRAFHAASHSRPLPPDLETLEPVHRIDDSLATPSPWSGTAVEARLRQLVEELEPEWRRIQRHDRLGTVVVHGDTHLDNALRAEEGVILIDLEDSGIGPASWDFVAPAVAVRRYGAAESDYREFVTAYGAEPTPEPDFGVMCRIYELWITAWSMACAADSPRAAAEAAIRIGGLLEGGESRWTLI